MASDDLNDPPDDLEIRRLFQKMEHTIKLINREKISELVGEVTEESFINVAKTVARLRAHYLGKVIELESKGDISGEDISILRGSRVMYEEALEGFSALQHALGRGYFSLSD